MGNSKESPGSGDPVSLKIKFKSENLSHFINRYSSDISQGGIFIRTGRPLSVGTALQFEFLLVDGSPLLSGRGTVVWTREADAKKSVAAGMGVRFDSLPVKSQEILEEILAAKEPSDLDDSDMLEGETKVAPPGLVEELTDSSSPFDDSADKFEVATKIAPLEQLLERAKLEEEGLSDATWGESAIFSSSPRPESQSKKPDPLDSETIGSADTLGGDGQAAQEEPDDETILSPMAFHDDTGLPLPTSAPQKEIPAEPSSGTLPEVGADELQAATEVATGLPPELEDAYTSPELGPPDEEPLPPTYPSDELTLPEVSLRPPTDPEVEAQASGFPIPGALPDALPAPARPDVTAELPPPTDKSGSQSNVMWIAVALGFLIVAGGGAFLFIGGDDSGATADVPAAEEPVAAHTALPTPASTKAAPTAAPTAAPSNNKEPTKPAPVKEPEVSLVDVEIIVRPGGARVALSNGTQEGISPMTFEQLDPNRTYSVVVSHPGYRTTKFTIRPTQPSPHQVQLEKLPLVLKVESSPPGATLTINSRRFGTTPIEAELTGALAAASIWRVSLRRPGFRPYEVELLNDTGFKQEPDRMVREFFATLTPRPYRPPTPPAPATTPPAPSGADAWPLNKTEETQEPVRRPADPVPPVTR